MITKTLDVSGKKIRTAPVPAAIRHGEIGHQSAHLHGEA
jgi:hypothetical protein